MVGPSRALEILLGDPNMSASEALAERLVAEVVAPEELMARARAKAEELAAKAPYYVRMAKLLCGQSIENNLAGHLELERHGIADSMATEDAQARHRGLLLRRKAHLHRPLVTLHVDGPKTRHIVRFSAHQRPRDGRAGTKAP